MKNKIIDIEKIGEKSKIELSNLKLVLKELLKDIQAEEEATNRFKVDISTIIAILKNKGIISSEEYEALKDKIDSIIKDMNKIEDAIENGDYSEESKEEIIKRSNFKGFFPTYEALLNKFPVNKAKHGDYAFIKDFEADTYDINNIVLYTYDVTYEKWILSSDLTEMRNVHIRDDGDRVDGRPFDRDILIYDFILKRWLNKSFDEADINRKSVFDDHFQDKLELVEDDSELAVIPNKNNGRLIIDVSETTKPNFHPMHIDRNQFNKLLREIDEDYFTTLHIGTQVDELGVERIVITEDDNDKYGNPIQRNVTNDVMRKIINHFYDKMFDTFDIKIDPTTGRILKIDDKEPEKYVPKSINTFNVDKIIKAIDKDYNNAFELKDISKEDYSIFLNKTLEEYNDSNITEEEKVLITNRLITLYGNKKLWGHFKNIPEYEKNKNMTPEIFNEILDVLNYLYISKDLIRDEILERDITVNGNRIYTNNTYFVNPNSIFEINSKIINFKNEASVIGIESKEINVNNNNSVVNLKSKKINVSNNKSIVEIESENINLNNKNGKTVINTKTTFNNDVTINGNVFISDDSLITEVGSENTVLKDNTIILNKGEKNNQVTKGSSGIRIDRGTGTDYFFGYDEVRKTLTSGYINDETNDSISKTNQVALLTLEDKKNNKPLVYNNEQKILENSNHLEVDFTGSNNITMIIPENTFEVFDVVRFDNELLVKCNLEKLVNAEAIGVITKIENDNLTITFSGLVQGLFVPDVKFGEPLYIGSSGKLSLVDYEAKIQRKIAIQTPQGLLVDIQKNNGRFGEELFSEYSYNGVLQAGESVIDVGCVADFNQDTKVFIDGILLTNTIHYDLDPLESLITLKTTFDYNVEYNIITNYYMGNAYSLVAENWEIDEIFEVPGIYPPNKRYFIATNRDIERMFGWVDWDDENDVEDPWIAQDEEIDDLFRARKMLMEAELQEEADINIKIFTSDGRLYFVSTDKYKKGTFIQIDDKGEYVPIDNNANNIIGIIQKVSPYKNGLIEYEVNTNKIIPYTEIPLVEYMNIFEMEFEIGETIYFKNKVNKFQGYKIGQFAKTVFFLEYDKNNYNFIEEHNNSSEKTKYAIKTLEKNKFYEISVEQLSIETIELFEVDTPNYCKLNLINNSNFNLKNMFATLEKGTKPLCKVFRNYNKFVISPLKNLSTKSSLEFKEIKENNFIQLL